MITAVWPVCSGGGGEWYLPIVLVISSHGAGGSGGSGVEQVETKKIESKSVQQQSDGRV